MTSAKDLILNLYKTHRFFIYALAVFLGLGIYMDLIPLLEEFNELLERKRSAILQLEEKEGALAQAGPVSLKLNSLNIVKTNKPLVDQIIQAAEMNACMLSSLHSEFKNAEGELAATQAKPGRMNRFIIKMQLNAHFFNFYRFLETLTQQGLPLRLDQLSLKKQGEILSIQLQFSAFPQAFWTAETIKTGSGLKLNSCCLRDPFGVFEALDTKLLALKPDLLQTLELEQIRYVGYLAEGGKTAALILLPEGRIRDIYPGSTLGKKQWRVVDLSPKALTLVAYGQTKSIVMIRA